MQMFDRPTVTHFEQDGVVVVAPIGEFDIAGTDLLRSAFADAISADRAQVVLDLSGTTFLDSMALGTIIGAGRRASGWGGWVRLVAPPANIRKVLHLTELDKVFGLYDTVDQAATHDVDRRSSTPGAVS
ncbi:MAG: anti-anti-sigma factor [Marmoricola sp.]|nr:anti-anti-sigma factor [Marmoricola sp.]